MRKYLLLAALTAGFAATPALANGSAPGGFYVGAEGGYQGLHVKSADGTVTAKGDAAVYGVDAGYDLSLGSAFVGVEGELSTSSGSTKFPNSASAAYDGLKANGVDPAAAVVVYIGGDPTDGNAKMFHDGAVSVMEAAGIKPAAEPAGVWDGEKSAANFEQALTSLDGHVDGVWAANDTNAAGVITILQKNGLAGKVPVSGQDASVAGLQNVLLGYQTGTVYKPYQLEAQAASDLAIALLNGETPTVDKKLDDGTPFVAVTPIDVRADGVQQVFDGGGASYDEVCTGDVKAACDAAGLTPAA